MCGSFVMWTAQHVRYLRDKRQILFYVSPIDSPFLVPNFRIRSRVQYKLDSELQMNEIMH
jgi:hypothetical protein